jgi:hypothetical protein
VWFRDSSERADANWEGGDAFGDSTPAASDAYLLTRLRLSADLQVTD